MSRSRRTAGLLLAVLAACAVAAPRADAVPAKASVVGGTPIAIETVPWQVFLRIGEDLGCGGSVLDASRVLTAAHCVVAPGQTLPRPASSLTVLAGFTDTAVQTAPAGSQVAGVASVRVHPLYEDVTKSDDVAVLTLAKPLNLAGAKTKAIALAPVGSGPAPGTALAFSGYGAQVEGSLPDGKLYGATLTAVADDACRPNIAVNASAGVQCVAAGNQAACFGDSGGPLTVGGLQVGVASYAPASGCGRGPYGFADVTAPEVRAFIDGAATVPVAPRQSAPSVLYSVNPPVNGSPMTCAPGTWANAPAFSYSFVNDASGVPLQSGASATFTPRGIHAGATIACLVHAANAGGTATARTGTAAAVQRDAIAPNASLYSARCRKRRCTVRFGAADPNSQGKLKLRVTAKKRGKRARRLAVRHVKGTTYRARSRKLRRGRTTIRVRVVDAGGNRRRPDLKRRVRVR